MMARAIVLAQKGQGRVEPNPMVGSVIVRDSRVIGEGYHRRFGGPHAEVEALRACTVSPGGSTVYVPLEPCCHFGKTPPCVDALIEAKVSRVVIGLIDPSPAASGRGIRRLRAAGIAVQTGVLAEEVGELLAPFLTGIRLGRPYVILKWAQSLDGKLTTPTGHSKWISCEASRRFVHRLRARVDAILVGSGTVLADDPMLTARGVPLRRVAIRVVLDSRLRISEKCHLVDTAGSTATLVMTTRARAKTPKAKRLARSGVEVIACRTRRGRLVVEACLKELHNRGVTNLLVEGGPTILTTFFKAGVVDEALVFTAPTLIGGRGTPGPLGPRRGTGSHPARCGTGFQPVNQVNAAINPLTVTTRRYGHDILHRLRLTNPPVPRSRP